MAKIDFTQEEIELLLQCLSAHFFQIGGMPETVVSCVEKLQDVCENKEQIERKN